MRLNTNVLVRTIALPGGRNQSVYLCELFNSLEPGSKYLEIWSPQRTGTAKALRTLNYS